MAFLQAGSDKGATSRSFLSTLARKTTRRRKFAYNSTDRQIDDEIRVNPVAPAPGFNRFPQSTPASTALNDSGPPTSLHSTVMMRQPVSSYQNTKALDSHDSHEWNSVALSSENCGIFLRPDDFLRSRTIGMVDSNECAIPHKETFNTIGARSGYQTNITRPLTAIPDEKSLIRSLEQRYSTSIGTITSLTDDAIDPIQFLSCPKLISQMRNVSRIDFSSYCLHNIVLQREMPLCSSSSAEDDNNDPVNKYLGNLDLLPNLKMLRLASTNLTSARFLAKLKNLEYCDLSHNKIADLTDLSVECEVLNSRLKIRHLDLRWNLIAEKADLSLNRLSLYFPVLKMFDLTGCPLISVTESAVGTKGKAFIELSQVVVHHLSTLEKFCGLAVDWQEGENAPYMSRGSIVPDAAKPVLGSKLNESSRPLEDSQKLPIISAPSSQPNSRCGSPEAAFFSFAPATKRLVQEPGDAAFKETAGARMHVPNFGDRPPAAQGPKSNGVDMAQMSANSWPTAERAPETQTNAAPADSWITVVRVQAEPPRPPSEQTEHRDPVPLSQGHTVPNANANTRGSLSLPTPKTPVTVRPNTDYSTLRTPPMMMAAASCSDACKPTRSLLPARSSPTAKSEAGASPVSCSTRASYEAAVSNLEPSMKAHDKDKAGLEPGTLRNLRLPNTYDETRVHPRRVLRDQPDASMLESTTNAQRRKRDPPVSLIGVELSLDSIQKAQQFVWEDPSIKHGGRWQLKRSSEGRTCINGYSPMELLPLPSDFPTLEEIQSLSQLLGETVEQCAEVEEDIRTSYEELRLLRNELLRSLVEFSKLRGTFFACLRRLGVAFQNRHPSVPADANVFVKFGLKIAERSESASRGLMLYVKSLGLENQFIAQSLQSQGGRATDFFTCSSNMTRSEAIDVIATWCLQEHSAEVFTSYLGTQLFCDFTAAVADPSSVMAYVSMVLKSHLPTDEMVCKEENMLQSLAALEQDINDIIVTDCNKCDLLPQVQSDPKFSISVVQLTDAAVRLKGSHSVFVPRILKLFLEHTKKADEVQGLLSLHRSALVMVTETKSRLKGLLEATATKC
eukprot:Gregarina_sp_Poly_1__8222@NODE_478_length_8064_cov_159_533200_g387_i0_p1_GENE_NODE_478_length_8064_cov_159_533200_g387_i0NODE_478_length_8064_cov_159_533200_g387_i0_p1_ORF_typecomplete_len1071_score171_56LRR_9/PF14580_6/5_9e09LRR_4/PF12799_7/2_2e07LRR_4/PF12799_7/7_8e02LRR_8/PF13855_6/5_1e03LRR_8/PF13855_6/0_00078LRR_8/PF13855_6/1_2e02IF4E/PF01652_18/0_3LRR_6/PF13516_6/11LRR_6/PF13516_6/20LRR_6/PF13516_6/1_3e04_NODE_478_length_8064_cov_159_533200_g387_i042807492